MEKEGPETSISMGGEGREDREQRHLPETIQDEALTNHLSKTGQGGGYKTKKK